MLLLPCVLYFGLGYCRVSDLSSGQIQSLDVSSRYDLRRRSKPVAAQFGLKPSVKSRKLSTAGESDALCRTNIAILHLTAGCNSGRKFSPKPRTSGSAIEGQITAPCLTRSIDRAVFTRCTGTNSFG